MFLQRIYDAIFMLFWCQEMNVKNSRVGFLHISTETLNSSFLPIEMTWSNQEGGESRKLQ